MTEELKYILSHRPSVFVHSLQMRGRLRKECEKVGIVAKWGGCSNCISTAYKALSRMFNYSFINELEKKGVMNNYKFRKDIDKLGYRDSKSGLVLRNDSDIALRKAVYERSDSHKTLFEIEAIPPIEEIPENKTLKPTSKSTKNRTTRKKKQSVIKTTK